MDAWALEAQWPWLIATLLGTGLVAGLLAGLLGVGGGIVVVPVLYHGFRGLGLDESVRMHVAVATSLATVAITAWRSARSHAQRGSLDRELLRSWGPGVAVGALAGAAITAGLSGSALAACFGSFTLAVALHMAFGREDWRIAAAPPAGFAGRLFAGAIGLLSAMLGLGAGTLGVTALTLTGVPIHRAVGTAAGLGPWIAVPGALGLAWAGWGVPGRPLGSLGYVNAVGFALIVSASWVAAPLGARFAHALPRQTLRRVFAAFLALTSLRMLSELLAA